MFEPHYEQWFTAARALHIVLSVSVALVVSHLIWSTSSVYPMRLSRWLACAFISLAAAVFMHWFLDVAVGLP